MSSSDHPRNDHGGHFPNFPRSISPVVYKRVSLKFLISQLLSSSYVISVSDCGSTFQFPYSLACPSDHRLFQLLITSRRGLINVLSCVLDSPSQYRDDRNSAVIIEPRPRQSTGQVFVTYGYAVLCTPLSPLKAGF